MKAYFLREPFLSFRIKCPSGSTRISLAVNSPFRERMHCTNNANTGSMREIDWEHGSPYIWQDHDYQTLINSNKIFARKFNSNQMGIVYKIQKLYLKQVSK